MNFSKSNRSRNTADSPLQEDWDARLRRRRRVRVFVAWIYLSSVSLTAIIHATRHWNAEQFEWLAKWGSLFMMPALCVWVWQTMRRRYVRQDAGELIGRFPPQRVGPLPRWLPAIAYLTVSVLPLMMLIFRDAHLLVMVAIAFAGVMMFALAWLRYDGIPIECRRHALVIDGVHLVVWKRILNAEKTKRSNVIRLLLWPRQKSKADDETRQSWLAQHESSFDSEPRDDQPIADGSWAWTGPFADKSDARPYARDVFVCAEDRHAFLKCVDACRAHANPSAADQDDVA